ncbi:hypothetical protein Bca4012_028073 [Brassica carinata]
MDPNVPVLVHTHLWLNQPVVPGGVLSEVDIYQQTPVELEENHPHLWFLVTKFQVQDNEQMDTGRGCHLKIMRKTIQWESEGNTSSSGQRNTTKASVQND